MADPVDNDKEAQDAGNILLDGLEGIIEALGCFFYSP